MVFGGNHLNVHPESATLREANIMQKLKKEYKRFEKQKENISARNHFIKNQHTKNLIHEHDRLTGEILNDRIFGVRNEAQKRLKYLTKQLEKELEKIENEK